MNRRGFLRGLSLTVIAISAPLSFAHKIPWMPKTADELYLGINALFAEAISPPEIYSQPVFAIGMILPDDSPEDLKKAEEALSRWMWLTALDYYREKGCRTVFWRAQPVFETDKEFGLERFRTKLTMRVTFT